MSRNKHLSHIESKQLEIVSDRLNRLRTEIGTDELIKGLNESKSIIQDIATAVRVRLEIEKKNRNHD